MEGWSLGISILALGVALMALPTVFQMVFGKVKIETAYKILPIKDQLQLACLFRNAPITNKFLKFIGVHRETAINVQASYDILDDNGIIIASNVLAGIIHNFEGDFVGKVNQKINTNIPTSNNYSYIPIALGINQKVIIIGDETHKKIDLPIGKYSATIKIGTSEYEKKEIKAFIVNKGGFGWCD